ncbi:MAG: hypothetical protein MUE71_11485 [Chitinophagaceae bacterium]|nr:hypothetical protein [Chitinophagaceae bacterium]
MRFVSFLTVFLWVLGLNAQVAVQPASARYLNLGSYSKKFNDVFGARANAASLTGLQQNGIGVYGERRFMLEELSMYNMATAFRTQSGSFGLSGSYFGFSESNQTQLSLSYGRKVSKTIDIGASFHYHNISQAGIYGNSSAITGSLSMLMHLSEKITAGFNVYNPFRAQWSKTSDDERLPSRYTFGLGYDASDKFYLAAELEKEEGLEVNVNLSLHYQIMQQLFVRGGIASLTSSYFAGLGLMLADFRIDFASSFHPQLGVSPGVVLLYSFGKKKDEEGK